MKVFIILMVELLLITNFIHSLKLFSSDQANCQWITFNSMISGLSNKPYFDMDFFKDLEIPQPALSQWEFTYSNHQQDGYRWMIWMNQSNETVYLFTEYDPSGNPTNQKTYIREYYEDNMESIIQIRYYNYSDELLRNETVLQFSSVPEWDFYYVENIEYDYFESGDLKKIESEFGIDDNTTFEIKKYSDGGKLIFYEYPYDEKIYQEIYQYDGLGRITNLFKAETTQTYYENWVYQYNDDGTTNLITGVTAKDISGNYVNLDYRKTLITNRYFYNQESLLTEYSWEQYSEIDVYSEPTITYYEYDENQNLTQKQTFQQNGEWLSDVSYYYDQHNRLTNSYYTYDYSDYDHSYYYQYDDNGNIITEERWKVAQETNYLLHKSYFAYDKNNFMIASFQEYSD